MPLLYDLNIRSQILEEKETKLRAYRACLQHLLHDENAQAIHWVISVLQSEIQDLEEQIGTLERLYIQAIMGVGRG